MSESKRSGCKGCLIAFLCIGGVILLSIGICAYFGYKKLVSLRDQYTETKPVALPVTAYSQTELDAVRSRIDQFIAAGHGKPTNAELSLTANDLNALLAAQGLSNRVYVTLADKSLKGQISVPLEDIGVRFLKGRYLNGSGVFDVGCENGVFSVKVKEINVGGKPLPEYYMKNVRDVNYAQGVATNTTTQEALRRLQRVEIDSNRLIFELSSTNWVR